MHLSIVIYLLLFLVLVDFAVRHVRGHGFFSKKIEQKYDLGFFFAQIFLLVMAFRALLFEPFVIPSSSMVPNLLIGDYILVNKMSYGYGKYSLPLEPVDFAGRIFGTEVKRGDVVVFRFPPNPKESYVKRIVGLPGDTLQMKKGILWVNGKPLPRTAIEDYGMDDNNDMSVQQFKETIPRNYKDNGLVKSYNVIQLNGNQGELANTAPYVVPAGQYFGVGDNRDNSLDSRVLPPFGVGFIPRENIIGRVACVLFSTNKNDNKTSFGWSLRFKRFFSVVQ
ncbi:MAG: signal peptidase I [Hydrotalea sp.]|nr:signal peptidase I [Hydrotalea sp.]